MPPLGAAPHSRSGLPITPPVNPTLPQMQQKGKLILAAVMLKHTNTSTETSLSYLWRRPTLLGLLSTAQ